MPVYADAAAEEMAYVLAHAEVRMAVVEDHMRERLIPQRRP